MKYIKCIFAALLILFLASCSFAGDVTTEHARNYVYSAGETIRFFDEKHDRDFLGELTFMSMRVLSEERFTQKERKSSADSGSSEYEDVEYNQIVQINYTYQKADGKTLGEKDFLVYDSASNKGLLNPTDAEFNQFPAENMRSMIVALKKPGDTIETRVMYSGMFTPNAIVKLSVGDNAKPSPKSDIGDSTTNIRTSQSHNDFLLVLFAFISLLLFSSTIVFMVLWIVSRRKNSK